MTYVLIAIALQLRGTSESQTCKTDTAVKDSNTIFKYLE